MNLPARSSRGPSSWSAARPPTCWFPRGPRSSSKERSPPTPRLLNRKVRSASTPATWPAIERRAIPSASSASPTAPIPSSPAASPAGVPAGTPRPRPLPAQRFRPRCGTLWSRSCRTLPGSGLPWRARICGCRSRSSIAATPSRWRTRSGRRSSATTRPSI